MPDFSHMSVAEIIAFLLPVALPFIVAVITKRFATWKLQATVLFALSCISGAVSTVILTDGEHWQDYVLAILYTAVVAFVTHYVGPQQPLNTATQHFGLGNTARSGDRINVAETARYP